MTDLKVGVCQTELPWGATSGASTSDVVLACSGIKSVGATSIRMTVRWANLDPAFDHNYKWDDLDQAVGVALTLGLDITLVIDPTRAVFAATSPNLNVVAEFGVLCQAIAHRYQQYINRWEIGNAINTIENFSFPNNPAKYVEYLASAFEAITAVQPSSTIFNGALASHLATDWSHTEAVEWTRLFYLSNPQTYFHGFAVHAYMLDSENVPLAAAGSAPSMVALDGIRAVMDANDDGEKKIHVHEWGFDSVRTVGAATTVDQLEDEQASEMLKQAELLQGLVDAGKIDAQTFLYNYRDWEGPNRNPLNHQGLVAFDFQEKKSARFLRGYNNRHTVVPVAVSDAVVPEVDLVFVPGAVIVKACAADAVTPVPGVQVPVPMPVAAATGFAPLPTVLATKQVEWVSTGAGARTTTGGAACTHTVTEERGGMLVVAVAFSHTAVKDWSTYTGFGVTSSIDGPLTRLSSTHLASASTKPGSVHLFGLFLPSAGTHTLTATAGGTTFASTIMASMLYKRVSGWGGAVTAANTNGAPAFTTATRTEDLVLVAAAQAEAPGTWNIDDRYSNGGSVAGVGDYMTVADGAEVAPSMSVLMSSTSAGWGAAAVHLRQWEDGHDVPVASAAVGSAVAPVPTLLGGNLTETVVASAVCPAPIVKVAVQTPVAAATGVCPVPKLMGGVEFVSGNGSTDFVTISSQRKTISTAVTVTEPNSVIVGGLYTGVQSGATLNTLTCTSNLSGSLSKLKSVTISSTRGVHMFIIMNPAVGTHTLTFVAQTSSSTQAPPVTNIQCSAGVYKNVAAYTSNVTKTATGVLDLVVTPAQLGSQCVCVAAFNGDPGVFDKSTRYRGVASSTQTVLLGDADGEGDFSTTVSRLYGAIGLSLDPPTL